MLNNFKRASTIRIGLIGFFSENRMVGYVEIGVKIEEKRGVMIGEIRKKG
ncbi:MAG: hypothetical protein K2H86_02825 [Muribaculaceae bacterium]|nr:hypothetical protein [Muribaculaceae bacterium]